MLQQASLQDHPYDLVMADVEEKNRAGDNLENLLHSDPQLSRTKLICLATFAQYRAAKKEKKRGSIAQY